MTTIISDLSEDLVEEILSRVPFTSLMEVRSSCKNWNALSKNQICGKGPRTSRQFLGFMLMDSRVYSMKFDLQGIHNNVDLPTPSIKQASILGHVKICKIFYCHGLLLCVTKDQKLVLWNPYLGQKRWIQPFKSFRKYAFGYDNKKGYHKILRFYGRQDGFFSLEIYDCNSHSWRVLDVTPEWYTIYCQSSESLKGNTYFLARKKKTDGQKIDALSLLSFDFTAERFGRLIPLPFKSYPFGSESVTLSCVRDEQLALLFLRNAEMMEFWITTKIDPYSASWSMFFKPIPRFPAGSFFIDEAEKKVVVVSSFRKQTKRCCYETAFIIGEDVYFKSVDIGEARDINLCGYNEFVVFTSYVPSLVQLKEKKEISNYFH